MNEETTLRSQENLQKLRKLATEIAFEGIRLTLDPQKITSAEAVIDDLCKYLQDEKDGRPNTTPIVSIQFQVGKKPQTIFPI